MKVLGISGSPRKGANSQRLVETILNGAKSNGAEIELIRLTEKKINGCIGCSYCKMPGHDTCSQKDDMADMYKKIAEADAIVFGSPVYFGRMNGQWYPFIDRLFAMLNPDFSSRLPKGKKIAVAVTCGSGPAEDIKNINASLTAICGYFGWENEGLVYQREVMAKDDIAKHKDTLEKAEKLGKKLTE